MKRTTIILFLISFVGVICGKAQTVDIEELKKVREEAIRTRDLTKMTELCSMYEDLYDNDRVSSARDSLSHWEYQLKREHLFQMKPSELEKYGIKFFEKKKSGRFSAMIAKLYEDTNAKKAIEWYRRTAYETRWKGYMIDIARLYQDGGKGLKRNYTQAIYWYYKTSDAFSDPFSDIGNKARKKIEWFKENGYINNQTIEKLVAIDEEEQRFKPKSVDENLFVSNIVADNCFAIIIANESYKYETSVDFANHDGEIMEQYCKKTLGIPVQQVFIRKNCSFNQMKLLFKTVQKAMADSGKSNAKIIFYYAGHGIPDEATKSPFLLPTDGFGNDSSSGYPLKQLYNELGQMTSGPVVAILDACFSGTVRSGVMMQSNTRGVALKPKMDTPPHNVVILSASQGDQAAYAYKDKRHGLFTYFLLEKLKDSKGEATLKEISDYVTSRVSENALSINKRPQIPTIYSVDKTNEWMSWKLK